MKIKKCRICESKNFFDLFSLGKLSFTGKFPKNLKDKIPSDFINLIMCKKCTDEHCTNTTLWRKKVSFYFCDLLNFVHKSLENLIPRIRKWSNNQIY